MIWVEKTITKKMHYLKEYVLTIIISYFAIILCAILRSTYFLLSIAM